MAIDRTAIAKAELGQLPVDASGAGQPYLHGEPEGLSGQFRRCRVQSGESQTDARCGGLGGAGQQARKEWQDTGDQSGDSQRHLGEQIRSRADPEYAGCRSDVKVDINTVPIDRFLRQIHHSRPLRFYRFLMAGHAVSREFLPIDLRETGGGQYPAELRAHRQRSDRSRFRRRRAGTGPSERRFSRRTRSTN